MNSQSHVKEPLVSVLVASFNQEQYVTDCLESIRKLDYPNLELIISDDASRDGTYELARQWVKDNRERFHRAVAFRQPENLGIVRHFQYLFDQARGEYIAYLAADDALTSSSIRFRLEILERDHSLDAVFGNAEQILANGAVLRPQFIPSNLAAQLSDRRLLFSTLTLSWCVPGPVMMLRRSATLPNGSLGPLPDDLEGEDAYIYTRLAALGKLAFFDHIVAKWRYVPGSSSNPVRQNHFTRRYTLESDRRNRHLVHGLDRLALDVRIADTEAVLSSRTPVEMFFRRMPVRILRVLLRILLRIRAFTRI